MHAGEIPAKTGIHQMLFQCSASVEDEREEKSGHASTWSIWKIMELESGNVRSTEVSTEIAQLMFGESIGA